MNPETVTVAPLPTSVKYAGFWIRWVANIIDGLVVGFFVVGVSLLQGLFIHPSTDITRQAYQNGVFLLFKMVLAWSYYVWMTDSYGATLGKKAVGIVVTSEDGSRLPIGRIILRETIGKWVSAMILMIGYLMAGFTKKKQALHDKFAKSVVVYKNPEHKNSGAVIAVVVGFSILIMITIIGIFASIVLASLSVARQKGNDAIIMADVDSTLFNAMTYYQSKNSFFGFKVSATSSIALPTCSSYIVNIAQDGQSIAVFGKMCSKNGFYSCSSSNGQNFEKNVEVGDIFAQSGKSSCH